MNCAVAFAPEGYGLEAKPIIADLLSGFGEGIVCLVWEGQKGTSMPTKVLHRPRPVGL